MSSSYGCDTTSFKNVSDLEKLLLVRAQINVVSTI